MKLCNDPLFLQDGEHSSVQDAQAAMCLYFKYRSEWERDIKEGIADPPPKKKGSKKSSLGNASRVLDRKKIAAPEPGLSRITSASGHRFWVLENCPRLSSSNNFATVNAFNTLD
jgi:hypothetical protein